MSPGPVRSEPFIWAHRGASAEAPENTLVAFDLALRQGAQGVELDVHLSRDGVPMVIHDETLDRTSNGRGRVSGQTSRALQTLDAGGWFSPAYSGERIPTLEQVLQLVGAQARINIEIKSSAAGAAVLTLLQRYPASRVLVSSFDHRLLARLRGLAPELALGFLVDSPWWRSGLGRALASGGESLHPRQELVSRPMLQACHRAGLKVYPWTVDASQRGAELVRLGCDGLFTNCPGALMAALRRV